MKLIMFSLLTVGLLVSCANGAQENTNVAASASKDNAEKSRKKPQDFNDYWYNGEAEITSYTLQQERYGAIRDGKAVTIFVTEPFRPKLQVKADNADQNDISVLKLNLTKKFNTGIYPYSIMSSVFSPIEETMHPLKISHSTQEWCGQVYMQLNNRKKFDIESHSYFEREADQELSLKKTWLEDELFNLIRLNPEELPEGEISIIPSFEYIRLRHKEIKPYEAIGLLKKGDSISSYSINYTNVKRSLKIYFNSTFPFKINGWEETHENGLVTKATALKTLRTAYWSQNAPQFESLRETLELN